MATPSKSLRFVLWVTQIILALMFLMSGWMKTTYPAGTLVLYAPWTAEVPLALARFIGVCELLGALGLVLPAATRWKPGLTPLAAALLAAVMALAVIFHLARGEAHAVAIPLMLGLLAAFTAWGRHSRAPIRARE